MYVHIMWTAVLRRGTQVLRDGEPSLVDTIRSLFRKSIYHNEPIAAPFAIRAQGGRQTRRSGYRMYTAWNHQARGGGGGG